MSTPTDSTVSFLFTDSEGSTRRWEADRAAMSLALTRHDALLQSAIDQAGGIVFKTVGDAYHAVFQSPASAVAAALAAQRALAEEDWYAFGPDFTSLRVRMSLHTGEAESRAGDWFGPPLNRTARLLSAAHAGQVLVSSAATDLLVGGLSGAAEPGAHLPLAAIAPDCGLRDLGYHRFKDLDHPERVWQLAAACLASDFPPIRSLDTHPNNLPAIERGVDGQDIDLTPLLTLLAARRLVTVVGPGGSGKTGLALRAARECLHRFPDGAWLVDLSPVREPALLAATVGAVLDAHLVATEGQPDPAAVSQTERHALRSVDCDQELALRLRGRRLLVVFDSCEQVVAACARLAAAILRTAPGVTVLATSREPLQIPEEALWPVMSPEASSAAGDLQAEQLLQASIDRSYRLLSPLDQRVLCRLSVADDPLPLAAALLVAADDEHDFTIEPSAEVATGRSMDPPMDEMAAMDAMDALVEKSLLIAQTREDGTWLCLPASVRAVVAINRDAADSDRARGRWLKWRLNRAGDATIPGDTDPT